MNNKSTIALMHAATDELYHHGILGMRWGHKNGPPYPLEPGDHSAAEKKAGWRKSLDTGPSDYSERKRKQGKKKKADDYLKYRELAKKKKSMLSNEELEYIVKRKRLEKEASGEKSDSRKIVEQELARFGTRLVTSAIVIAGAAIGAKYLKTKYKITPEFLGKKLTSLTGRFASTVAKETASAVKSAMPSVGKAASDAGKALGKGAIDTVAAVGEAEIKLASRAGEAISKAASGAAKTASEAVSSAARSASKKAIGGVAAVGEAEIKGAEAVGKAAVKALTTVGEAEISAAGAVVDAGRKIVGAILGDSKKKKKK